MKVPAALMTFELKLPARPLSADTTISWIRAPGRVTSRSASSGWVVGVHAAGQAVQHAQHLLARTGACLTMRS